METVNNPSKAYYSTSIILTTRHRRITILMEQQTIFYKRIMAVEVPLNLAILETMQSL